MKTIISNPPPPFLGELSTAYKSDLNRVGNEINLTNEDDHRGLVGV